jgi:hypothetical protein
VLGAVDGAALDRAVGASWLVETKKAHYIAVIKTNRPAANRQLAALPWRDIAIQHTTTSTGHGRHASGSIKTCGIADELGGIAFPHARLASHSCASPCSSQEARGFSPGRNGFLGTEPRSGGASLRVF